MSIEAIDLSFTYGERMILDHVSFLIPDHSITTVLGPNGAGKTTLLKVLLGFEKMDGGHVRYDGKNLHELVQKEFWKNVGYVPQAKQSIFPLTVEETVLTGRTGNLSMFEKPGKDDFSICEEAMHKAGIFHLKDRNCSTLSGGELQLVHIARALAARPRILVLDEPETGLDFENQLMVLELLKQLNEEDGMTVVYNTHYPDHAIDFSTHTILFMGEGKIIYGPHEQILTKKNMEHAFHVSVELFRGKRHAVIPVGKE